MTFSNIYCDLIFHQIWARHLSLLSKLGPSELLNLIRSFYNSKYLPPSFISPMHYYICQACIITFLHQSAPSHNQPMFPFTIGLLLLLLGALFSFIHLRPLTGKLPPGPWALPIIGNLHMLGNLPQRNLSLLAKKYGPIMSMRLGYVPATVVSSPEVPSYSSKLMIFGSRPTIQASEYLTYGS